MAFESVYEIIAEDLAQVEKRLVERTVNAYEFVDLAVRHVIEGGGKRLRPTLTLLSARATGGDGDAMYDLAAAMELIHVASLVHDDVIDEARLRRSRETLNAKFGNKVAVLVGDYMHARVLAILVACGANEAMYAAVAEATQGMCEGEVIHAYKADDFELGLDDYLKIIELKTARLMACSCKIGAALGSDDSAALESLASYGSSVGIAFQIVDDVLDLVGKASVFGKPTRNDLREGKLTLPVMYLRDHCAPDERARLRELMLATERSEEDVNWVVSRAEAYEASDYAIGIAREYSRQAASALSRLPDGAAKSALEALASDLVERDR